MAAVRSEFDAIYTGYRPRVLRYLARLVGRDEAEDLAQIVFLKVYAARDEFRGDSSLSTWIYRIATNTALDHQRSRAFRDEARSAAPNGRGNGSGDDGVAERPDDGPDCCAEAIVMRRQSDDCVGSFIDALPEVYRTVLALSDRDGLRDREIARRLGVSLETVKIRLHRARLALKKRFESECYLYPTKVDGVACGRKAPVPPAGH
jgi:RNA polymerase sigma-70 factor (ECF subfamily)